MHPDRSVTPLTAACVDVWRRAIIFGVVSMLKRGAWWLLAGFALTGCGSVGSIEVTTGSSCEAAETTSPEWVFSLFLSSGVVAFTSAMIWLILLLGPSGPPPTAQGRWTRLRIVALLLYAVWVGYRARDLATNDPDRWILAITVVFIALPLTGFYAAVRRYRSTGQWPRGRNAPWGMFWVLPILFASAVSAATWSLWTMIDSMVSVPC